MKRILQVLWNKWYDLRQWVRQQVLVCLDVLYVQRHKPPQVLSIADTLEKVAREQLSVSRFGDGEIKLAAGKDISFQRSDDRLQKELAQVLSSNDEGFLVCLPDVFADRSYLIDGASLHWKKHLAQYRREWYAHILPDKVYGNSFLSRCYYILRDKSRCGDYFRMMRRIWDGQDILLVEGEKSRLGVGNDLFDNARSVCRILGPVENAWTRYDALFEAAKQHGRNKLILLALGPAATVMSYALFQAGYHAVDLGHADIEYEWFLAGVTERRPVKNKYVNEAGAGADVGALEDETYQRQILETIL